MRKNKGFALIDVQLSVIFLVGLIFLYFLSLSCLIKLKKLKDEKQKFLDSSLIFSAARFKGSKAQNAEKCSYKGILRGVDQNGKNFTLKFCLEK